MLIRDTGGGGGGVGDMYTGDMVTRKVFKLSKFNLFAYKVVMLYLLDDTVYYPA